MISIRLYGHLLLFLFLSREILAFSSTSWVDLTENGAVQKHIITDGTGTAPKQGDTVEINYVGTLMDNSWNPSDVVQCWLLSQQGLDDVAKTFLELKIDGNKLTDDSFFTEEFVTNSLGLSNKIKCKKLVMAARRLKKSTAEFPAGAIFDSTEERGNSYTFVLGQGKLIKGMELGVATMKKGERAKIKCRADYAYGSEGYRKSNGEVVVPPFATLCFDITLLN